MLRKSHCIGISYIELLVSLTLFSITILLLNAAQVVFFREAQVIYNVAVATQQIQNIATAILNTPTISHDFLIQRWNKQNAQVLPRGNGDIEKVSSHYAIKVVWGGMSNEQCLQNTFLVKGCLQILL